MQWLRGEGRLFPLAFFNYSVFYLLQNVLLYKIFVLSVILGSIAAFFLFLRRLTCSESIAAISVLLLPLMFQFRASWDPILAFNAACPLIALLLFCSMNQFMRNVDEGDRGALWRAILMFLCCGLIFEVTYPMFLAFGFSAYSRLKTFKAAALASWPFFVVTFCLSVASAVFRARATSITSTYSVT